MRPEAVCRRRGPANGSRIAPVHHHQERDEIRGNRVADVPGRERTEKSADGIGDGQHGERAAVFRAARQLDEQRGQCGIDDALRHADDEQQRGQRNKVADGGGEIGKRQDERARQCPPERGIPVQEHHAERHEGAEAEDGEQHAGLHDAVVVQREQRKFERQDALRAGHRDRQHIDKPGQRQIVVRGDGLRRAGTGSVAGWAAAPCAPGTPA